MVKLCVGSNKVEGVHCYMDTVITLLVLNGVVWRPCFFSGMTGS